MKPKNRFLRFIKNAFLVFVGAMLLLGLVVYSQGAVMVYVHEKKPDSFRVFVPVPALLVTESVRFVPERDLREASGQLRQWLPAIRVAAEELAKCPDGLLVEVKDHQSHVLISKSGDNLLIAVDDEDDNVRISMPIETLATVAEHLRVNDSPI